MNIYISLRKIFLKINKKKNNIILYKYKFIILNKKNKEQKWI